jgi:hypothetical protein
MTLSLSVAFSPNFGEIVDYVLLPKDSLARDNDVIPSGFGDKPAGSRARMLRTGGD